MNLWDEKLCNIILITTDRAEFLQMLGRKRIREIDKEELKVYIPVLGKNQLNGILQRSINPYLGFVDEMKRNNMVKKEKILNTDFCLFIKNIAEVIDGKIFFSWMAEEKLLKRKKFLEKMLWELERDPFAFVKEQLRWLCLNPNTEFSEEHRVGHANKENEKIKFLEFLQSIVDREMNKEEQLEFRKNISCIAEKTYGIQLTDRSSRRPGKKVINDFFDRNKIPYRIETVGRKSLWRIVIWQN